MALSQMHRTNSDLFNHSILHSQVSSASMLCILSCFIGCAAAVFACLQESGYQDGGSEGFGYSSSSSYSAPVVSHVTANQVRAGSSNNSGSGSSSVVSGCRVGLISTLGHTGLLLLLQQLLSTSV
jgi:hypothetical protein